MLYIDETNSSPFPYRDENGASLTELMRDLDRLCEEPLPEIQRKYSLTGEKVVLIASAAILAVASCFAFTLSKPVVVAALAQYAIISLTVEMRMWMIGYRVEMMRRATEEGIKTTNLVGTTERIKSISGNIVQIDPTQTKIRELHNRMSELEFYPTNPFNYFPFPANCFFGVALIRLFFITVALAPGLIILAHTHVPLTALTSISITIMSFCGFSPEIFKFERCVEDYNKECKRCKLYVFAQNEDHVRISTSIKRILAEINQDQRNFDSFQQNYLPHREVIAG